MNHTSDVVLNGANFSTLTLVFSASQLTASSSHRRCRLRYIREMTMQCLPLIITS